MVTNKPTAFFKANLRLFYLLKFHYVWIHSPFVFLAYIASHLLFTRSRIEEVLVYLIMLLFRLLYLRSLNIFFRLTEFLLFCLLSLEIKKLLYYLLRLLYPRSLLMFPLLVLIEYLFARSRTKENIYCIIALSKKSRYISISVLLFASSRNKEVILLSI